MWSDHVRSKSEKVPQERDQWQETSEKTGRGGGAAGPDDGNTPKQVDEQEKVSKER